MGPFARALDELRAAARPVETDRVVPLSPYRINERLQVLAERVGLEGVSSHSGRRGLAAELVRRGASTTEVQMAGGWRSPQMVARYASGVAVVEAQQSGQQGLPRRWPKRRAGGALAVDAYGAVQLIEHVGSEGGVEAEAAETG